MKLSKKIVVAAAAGALAVTAAVPAMALENEFSGIYNLRFYLSNVDNGTWGAIIPGSATGNTMKANNYFEQRARVKYTAKASDDLKLVTHFELDSKFGGQGGSVGSAGSTSGYKGIASNNDSGQLDADSVSLETKNVYLDFNLGKNVNVKTGIQPVSDKLKGILISAADLAGVNTTTKLGSVVLNAGFFRMWDSMVIGTSNATTAVNGQNTFDLGLIDAQFNVNKNFNVGAAYYLISDSTDSLNGTSTSTGTTYSGKASSMIHTLGLYTSGKIGAATLSGFVAAQTGYGFSTANNSSGFGAYHLGQKQQKSGFAANAAVKIPVGPGIVKAGYLYTSGDDRRDNRDTSWTGINKNNSSSTTSYNESGMMLLVRNLNNTIGSTDRELIQQFGGYNNAGSSIISAGYDANITPKVFVNVNAGVAFASKNQSNILHPGNGGASNLMGVEGNVEAGYKVYENLTAKVQAAYVALGGYYTGGQQVGTNKIENPYTSRVVLQYAF